MGATAILYRDSTVMFVLALFVLILLANEAAFRYGRRNRLKSNDTHRVQTNAIAAALLGLLSLILGFTFTIALQRYDGRSRSVVDEANAIATAHLRTRLLPEPFQAQTADLIKEYLDLRVRSGTTDLTQTAALRELDSQTGRVEQELWSSGVMAAMSGSQPVTTGLYLQSVNEMFDARARRNALLQAHVPEAVLLLLFAVFLGVGAVSGYAGGIGGTRPLFATIALAALIAALVFIVVDLDRPRRGLITVSQESIVTLNETLVTPVSK